MAMTRKISCMPESSIPNRTPSAWKKVKKTMMTIRYTETLL